MEPPAISNSTTSKRTRASTADLTAVPLLQAMLDQLRGELATVRMALDSERNAVRSLKRDKAAELKALREEEAKKGRDALSDLKSRLEHEHEDSLQRQKDALTKALNSELVRALKAKDAEMRQELSEAHAREEELKHQVREAHRAKNDAVTQHSGASNGQISKLQQEVSALRTQNKQLEERLQIVIEADRQKTADLRSQHDEHELQLIQIKKISQQETNRLLEELKSKDRLISQLERQLSQKTGRIEEQREKLLEMQHEPHPRECECSELNCTRARERRLIQRLAELQSSMIKAENTHAQEKKEMIRKLRELEGKSPVSRQPQKNPRSPKRNSQQTSTSNGETVAREDVGDKEKIQQSEQELNKLRVEIEERDRIIAELQQAAREKDRRLDHLSNRHRKEQMKQYCRQFMELEPVEELEEDSGAGEDSPSSSGSPSLSPQPFSGDMWAELTDPDTLYSCLLKEHLELQKEYQFLQARLRRELAEPNRIRLRLEHELAAARTQVRELKRMLAEMKGSGIVMAERIESLQAEAHDLREQNELLEFRILELEECHDNSSIRSHGPDTRDVWTDTENDEVSDSGVLSLPTSEDISSDTDLGIHDIKLENRNEELKDRLLEFAKTSSNTAERCCLQQVLALLESYESRMEKLEELQDEKCSTVTPDSPSSKITGDLGRGLKNLPESTIGSLNDSSKLTSRIIATVLPFTDPTTEKNKDKSDGITEGDTLKKQLKNAECLQESGIFEDTEFNTQGTQTDFVTQTTGDFKSTFGNEVVGDLSAEIQKLNQIRERVEERGCGHKSLQRVETGRVDDTPQTCVAHLKELKYYRERLQILEDKVDVYESSGEHQAHLLAERLQKEIRLSAQVKELSSKVEQLFTENKRLEEERCEFEEAENDTRLRCQKLEVKIIALNEKKSDLLTQLQQERRNMNRLRTSLSECERKKQEARGQLSYIEAVLNKYEHRNYELEEREVELRHRLDLLEKTIPALLMWNLWRIVQKTKAYHSAFRGGTSSIIVKARIEESQGKMLVSGQEVSLYIDRSVTSPGLAVALKQEAIALLSSSVKDELRNLKENLDQNLTERQQAEEKWQEKEKQLKKRMRVLECQAESLALELRHYKEAEEQYKSKIMELENEISLKIQIPTEPLVTTLYSATSGDGTSSASESMSCPSIGTESLELKKKIHHLIKSEADMKKRITELELKEKAYMETIQQADELWSEMENSYKAQITKAEDSEAALRNKVKKMEENETKLRQVYTHEDENYVLMEKIHSMEQNEKTFVERIHSLEAEKNKLLEERTHLHESLISAQTELQKIKEELEGPLKSELCKERKLSKMLQEEIKTMESELHEVTKVHESQLNGLKGQLNKTSRELVDMECTNSELKEEVETLEAKVSELKTSLEFQKANEEKLVISMSQKLLDKEKELEETKREMEFAKTPSAHEELKEALPGMGKPKCEKLSTKPCLKDFACPTAQKPPVSLEAQTRPDELLTAQVDQPPSDQAEQKLECEKPVTKPSLKECTNLASQKPPLPPPLSQKPVLRRWLHQEKEWRQW